MKQFTKIIPGFVTQHYTKNTAGQFVCTGQEFFAGDEVQYENAEGDPITPPTHDYQPLNMTLYSGPQIAESLREAIKRLKVKNTAAAGIRILNTLLMNLG